MRIIGAQYPKIHTMQIVTQKSDTPKSVSFDCITGFLQLAHTPLLRNSFPCSDYSATDDKIEFASDGATYVLRYCTETGVFSDNLYNEELNIDSRAEHLLPLLCAAYYWQEDEPEKSTLYMQEYRLALSYLRERQHSDINSSYLNTNNW